MNSPKISIVIPVYNVENYIVKCLDSIVHQTFTDIEIVCVNDGSTDSSLRILKTYAAEDSRIVIVNCKNNQGLLVARKKGVAAATGEYLIFVDSDDYIDLNLCQFISDISKKEDADIIHFSSEVDSNSKDKNYDALKNALKPYEKSLNDEEVLEHAFIKRTFATQVWAKIYRTELCKKVYEILPDEHCYVGEDVFAMFFLTMFAKKYIGVITPGYYKYRFGLGISGKSKISVSKFEMYAQMSNWIRFTQNYLNKHNATEVQIKSCERMKERLFADCCEIFRKRVKETDKNAAGDLIYKYWKDLSVSEALWIKHTGYSQLHFEQQSKIKENIISSDRFDSVQADLSLVIYGHNSGNNFETTVCDILKSNVNIEIICINDGSGDNTAEILKNICMQDNRVVAVNQKYTGMSEAKNKAFKISKGKYVCYINAEDTVNISCIESIAECLNNSCADVVFCNGKTKGRSLKGKDVLIECLDKNTSDTDFGQFIIKKDFVESANIEFNRFITKSDELFMITALTRTEQVKLVEDKLIIKNNNNKNSKTEDFTDYFIICNLLNAAVLIDSSDDDSIKDILSSFVKIYDTLCKKIYKDLSISEIKSITKKLPAYYLYSFYNFRDLEEIKKSKSYKISQSMISKADKLLGRFK